MMSVAELERLLKEPEGENLEFKKAQSKFGTDELTKYCVALANEGGGRIVFGVTDRRPRQVSGTTAFAQPEEVRKTVLDRLKIPVHFDVVEHPDGRRFLGTYVPAKLDELGTDDWLALSQIASEQTLSNSLEQRVDNLLSRGLIERIGGGRYILPRIYYRFHNREASYNRLREREQRKEQVEGILKGFRLDGRLIGDLHEEMPTLERKTLRRLLLELQEEGRVHSEGENRWTRYFPGPTCQEGA